MHARTYARTHARTHVTRYRLNVSVIGMRGCYGSEVMQYFAAIMEVDIAED